MHLFRAAVGECFVVNKPWQYPVIFAIMNIALVQQNYHIGHFAYNTQKIVDAIQAAERQGAELVVFSELCVCGYPPRDFLEFNDFIDQCLEAIETIASHTRHTAVLIGAPARNDAPGGKDLFNAAYFLYEGQVKQIVHKTLLPTYDVFDEYRYFEPAWQWKCVDFKGQRLAVTICEDIWNLNDNPLYRHHPMDELMGQKPTLMINLSASPFDYTHHTDRQSIVRSNVLQYKLPMVYVNAVGSQTEIVFDGGSMAMGVQGDVHGQIPLFHEGTSLVRLTSTGHFEGTPTMMAHELPLHELNPAGLMPELNLPLIYEALIMGIRDYFTKMGFTKAILGSSGGIDSAVVQTLAADALGAENVLALLMPSPYSTGHSVNDATLLSQNLGTPYHLLRIDDVYQSFLSTLKPIFGDLPFSLAEENIQSRSRGNLLMAVSNKLGYILLNTSNKSELATGYGTLYGDMAGGLGVLGDLYKMQIFALAKWLNRNGERIPQNIITKPPSAELRPGQKDSDSLPDYALLDAVLYQYIEQRKGPQEIKQMGFDAAIVDRTLKLVNTNEYKRNQFCPIIRVSPKAFGVGRRMPIVGKYLS